MSLKGVVFIVSDALRGDVFDRLYELNLIPNLKNLAKSGTRFKDVHATSNTTDPSITTMLSGLHPLTHGIVRHGDITAKTMARGVSIPSLAQMVRPEFRTAAIDFQIPGLWHGRGYDTYVSKPQREGPVSVLRARLRRLSEEYGRNYAKRIRIPGVLANMANGLRMPQGLGPMTGKSYLNNTAVAAFTQMKSLLTSRRRFFLFIHFWATHAPYYASPETVSMVNALGDHFPERRRLSQLPVEAALSGLKDPGYKVFLNVWFKLMNHKTLWDVVASNYASLIEVDRRLGDLVHLAVETGEIDNLCFLFTADHGESLGEHRIFFSHHGLYEPTTRVPLVVSGFAVEGDVTDAPVSHVDIVPTLLAALGREHSESRFDGFNLVGKGLKREVLEGRPLIAIETLVESKVSVLLGKHKLIRATSAKGATCELCGVIHGGATEELYDLGQDPDESVNEALAMRDVRAVLDPIARRAIFKLNTREAIAKVRLPM